jgi:hypothetical protein
VANIPSENYFPTTPTDIPKVRLRMFGINGRKVTTPASTWKPGYERE